MTCRDCTDARERSHHGFSDCQGCRARAVARSVHFAKAWKTQRRHREYVQLLEFVKVTHEEVVEAAKSDRACDRLLGKVAA